MLVKVTQADIDAGYQADCDNCPVALALQRATALPLVVSQTVINLPDGKSGGVPRWWDTPPDVAAKITDFDEGRGMEPFSFEIDLDIANTGPK